MLNFNQAFKETMDSMGVRNKDLAEISGRSLANISEIRNGKAHPTTKDFADLIDCCEKLAPGFTKEFNRRLAGKSFEFSPEELIDCLDSAQIAALMFAVAGRIASSKFVEKVVA
jgi:DNA-binding Xre family transcriptional regulator